MRVKASGGVATVTLYRAEVSKLLDGIIIGRQLSNVITKDKDKLVEAVEVLEAAVRKFGAEHLAPGETLALALSPREAAVTGEPATKKGRK